MKILTNWLNATNKTYSALCGSQRTNGTLLAVVGATLAVIAVPGLAVMLAEAIVSSII